VVEDGLWLLRLLFLFQQSLGSETSKADLSLLLPSCSVRARERAALSPVAASLYGGCLDDLRLVLGQHCPCSVVLI
jgi:hypothetical protein